MSARPCHALVHVPRCRPEGTAARPQSRHLLPVAARTGRASSSEASAGRHVHIGTDSAERALFPGPVLFLCSPSPLQARIEFQGKEVNLGATTAPRRRPGARTQGPSTWLRDWTVGEGCRLPLTPPSLETRAGRTTAPPSGSGRPRSSGEGCYLRCPHCSAQGGDLPNVHPGRLTCPWAVATATCPPHTWPCPPAAAGSTLPW
jgi:hypothetical protein